MQAVLKAVVWEGVGHDVSINSAVSGAFSKRGARETAFMLQAGGPQPADPRSLMDTVIAVFSGDRVVAAAQATGSNSIVAAQDVDGDGADELLVDGSLTSFGVLVTSARLVRVSGRQLKTVHDFKGVYEGACGDGQNMGIRAGVLRQVVAGTGGKPTFRVDLYGAPCRPDGKAPAIEEFKPLPGEKIV